MRWLIASSIALLAAGTLAGCVRRTLTIRTEPPGALLWLNDREVGRTPVDVEFLYYGEYDVRLEKPGFEPLMTSARADAPIWDWPGVDLAAELMPFQMHSRVEWDFVLEPAADERAGLIERARALRATMPPGEPAPAPEGDNPAPDGRF